MYAAGLRAIAAQRGPTSRAARYVELLLDESEAFREYWDRHEIGIRPRELKRYIHPEVGLLELTCQVLTDAETSHSLLVYTAVPGSESAEKLQLLGVLTRAGTR